MFTAEHYKMSIRRENEKHFYFSLVIFLAILLGIFHIFSRHVYTVCVFFLTKMDSHFLNMLL